jgi:hypothetical protein
MAAAADVIDARGLRGPVDGLARHGADGPRDQAARGAHFGRMFGWLPEGDLGQEAIDELAEALTRNAGRSTDNLDVPAGYTYFGQFVDHDTTCPSSRSRRRWTPRVSAGSSCSIP